MPRFMDEDTVQQKFDTLPTIQSGTVVLENVTADGVSTAPVVFPTEFASKPVVTVTADSGFPGTVIEASASDITTTGFSAKMWRTSSVTTTLMWIAVVS